MVSLHGLSTIGLSNPGFHGEREVAVGNLSLGWRSNGTSRASFQIATRDAQV